MLPFRTEIRNSPTQQTIKVFLSDESLDNNVKHYLESFNEIELIEIRKSVERNRVSENITIFRKDGVDINSLQTRINEGLNRYFSSK
ncbi:hypothetical protein [Jejuia spongiicola]|uniref:Uncharacterized protein n=1 Tax=Jejuia spongiicola TaxID=2942207 RepID=A0ABT0QAZ0_9FLAO|nr:MULTISPECIES: hypothetical protein [Flavobacteriaceae]MCL6293793.1 hypothetical protein [Jejuia spongiicola]PIA78656.1 hypothetical protein BFR04_03740 [Gaetbulibacter sp. 4G1]